MPFVKYTAPTRRGGPHSEPRLTITPTGKIRINMPLYKLLGLDQWGAYDVYIDRERALAAIGCGKARTFRPVKAGSRTYGLSALAQALVDNGCVLHGKSGPIAFRTEGDDMPAEHFLEFSYAPLLPAQARKGAE